MSLDSVLCDKVHIYFLFRQDECILSSIQCHCVVSSGPRQPHVSVTPHAGYRFYLQDDLADNQGAYGAHGGDLALQFAGLHAQTQQNTSNGGSESFPPSDIRFCGGAKRKAPTQDAGRAATATIPNPYSRDAITESGRFRILGIRLPEV